MEDVGKTLLLIGISIAILGGLLVLLGRVPGIGRMPGDFTIQIAGFSCCVPLATSLLFSLIATIVLNLILRVLYR